MDPIKVEDVFSYSEDDEPADQNWAIELGRLQMWSEIYGCMPHPCSNNPIEKGLSKFILDQWWNKTHLTDFQLDSLNSTDNWFWGDFTKKSTLTETNWDISFGRLEMWVELKKEMPQPYTFDDIENKQFEFCNQQWINRQSLDEEKITRLKSIKGWFWGKPITEEPTKPTYTKLYTKINSIYTKWATKLGKFQIWTELSERLPHPYSPDLTERCLSKFLLDQWRNKKQLTAIQLDLLKSTKYWFWGDLTKKSSLTETNWEISYGCLVMWVKFNKVIPYPFTSDDLENEQFEFCNQQWINKNSLSDDKIAKLQSIKGWFWGKPIEELIEEEPIDELIEEEPVIAKPVKSIKIKIKSPVKKLTRSRAVESLKGKSPTYCEKQKIKKPRQQKPFWERFNELYEWVEKRGRLPTSQSKLEPEENSFARFCLTQRSQYRLGRMSVERKRKMDTIPGWHW